MRVAAIYDIHGNRPALEAVLDDVRRADVDRVVVGAKAAERIRDTQYPDAETFAARNVLQPPSEAATLTAFARAEVK
jgi:hypothetical protein